MGEAMGARVMVGTRASVCGFLGVLGLAVVVRFR